MKRTNLIGKRFGRLVVLSRTDKRTKRGTTIWECVCDCGTRVEVRTDKLTGGGKRSCGCWEQENAYKYFRSPYRPKHRSFGKDNPAWKGGRTITGGYFAIRAPHHPYVGKTGYIMEHRIIMERRLGRYLKSHEVVHHIDGNPYNNDSANLHLFPNDVTHFAWHKRLEEIATYD